MSVFDGMDSRLNELDYSLARLESLVKTIPLLLDQDWYDDARTVFGVMQDVLDQANEESSKCWREFWKMKEEISRAELHTGQASGRNDDHAAAAGNPVSCTGGA